MTSLDVVCALLGAYPNANFPPPSDTTYQPITVETLGKVGILWRDVAFAFDVEDWSQQSDCDDKALLAKLCMSAMHRRASRIVRGAQSAAFGMLYYVRDDTGTGHALNWAITERGITEWEPITQCVVILSENERRSVYFCFC